MSELKKTPLYEVHRKLGGKLVDFAGWEMPVQYQSVVAEHNSTRNSVGLFDVSHMGEVFFEGKAALSNLQRLTCNDVSKLAIGQVQYSALLYDNGTFVDDITVYRLAENRYFLCVNAANTDKDCQWMQSHLQGEVHCENRSSEFGQIAIQGKNAIKILQEMTQEDLSQIPYYWFREIELCGSSMMLARMGYTGEDGFEIYCPQEHTVMLWETLLAQGKSLGITPAGLAARDTLRMEVCFPLYGQDIDDQHNPLEAGLGRFVALDKADFIGKSAVEKVKAEGIRRKLIRFVLDVRGVPRPYYLIFDETGEQALGEVTSGTSSPTLGQGIGMGYVPIEHAKIGSKLTIQIRNKMVPATIVKPPFVKVQ